MKERSNAAPVVVLLMVLLLGYIGSYFALVVPCGVQVVVNPSFGWPELQSYRCGDKCGRVFWPLEQIDRKVRPRYWEDPSTVIPRA